MPGCEEEVLEKLEHNVTYMPYVTQLLEIGFSPEKMIEIIGRELEVDIKESYPVEFKCRCSRERIESALLAIDKASLEEMSQDEFTEAHCQFCNTTYKFSSDEIKALLADK
jgi:molecular chaperone Hsp33